MAFDIKNFLPKYPEILRYSDSILNPYPSGKFNDLIASKKEFSDLKLSQRETIVEKGTGAQYDHQKIITRFMSSKTPYDRLLLFHEMGTGKTCTAISVIEQLRYEKNGMIKGAIVCAKGTGLLKNFVQELLFSCTDGRYVPEDYDKLTDLERVHRIKKITSKFYHFQTFETFARDLSKLPDETVRERYSNLIFVVDEVHNLREKGDEDHKLNVYKQFHRLFHLVVESKILLMSGTVMKDDPLEFSSVMNLILPLDSQLPSDKDFLRKYFDSNGMLRRETVDDLADKCKGRISYLKTMTSEIRKVFVGEKIGNLKHFIVYPETMSRFQTEHYLEAYDKDSKEKNIFSNSRQASLFVFPDGSYGQEGFQKYVLKKNYGGKVNYALSRDLVGAIGKNLSNLGKYSDKFAATLKTLLNEPKTKVIVYCEFVNGSGCILFSKILEQFGYFQAKGDEKTKALRYAILTNQTTNQKRVQQIITRFNREDNIDGEYISIVIGSKIISEGYTFKNVRKEFIFTPHWNYSDTAQVIARGWRLGSHDDLVRRGDVNLKVEIYQMVSLPEGGGSSIDLEMYETSEKKDVSMKQIEYVVKRTSFDCPLMMNRNKILGYDDMRECDYEKCDYECSGKIALTKDRSTYDLYYSTGATVKKVLRNHFKTFFFMSLEELFGACPDMDRFSVVKSLMTVVNENVEFLNRYGLKCYIRISGKDIYATSDAKMSSNDQLAVYYVKNFIIRDGDPFDKVLTDLQAEKLPEVIDSIFEFPEFMKNTLSSLPELVQKEILQASITAEELGIEKNVDVRKKLLESFKGFFEKIGGEWVVWLHKDSLGVSRLRDGEWNYCNPQETRKVEEYISKKRTEFIKSPIGYYGLYNPQLGEFCIRDVRDHVDVVKDFRKLVIGRRCTDWDQNSLVDIVARRMEIGPPREFMRDLNYSELKELVMSNKYRKIPDDVQNEESMKRLLYWSKMRRVALCQVIKSWLTEKNLVEENFDCGTQKKQRKKFVQ
jgi:superfamily II DNA or RNA helicase